MTDQKLNRGYQVGYGIEERTLNYILARVDRVIRQHFDGWIRSDLRYWVWSLEDFWPEFQGAYTTYDEALARKQHFDSAVVWFVPIEVWYALDVLTLDEEGD